MPNLVSFLVFTLVPSWPEFYEVIGPGSNVLVIPCQHGRPHGKHGFSQQDSGRPCYGKPIDCGREGSLADKNEMMASWPKTRASYKLGGSFPSHTRAQVVLVILTKHIVTWKWRRHLENLLSIQTSTTVWLTG
jgi:hypothetical protein